MLGFKNLLALLGLALVAFVGAGYYLGWYSIGAQADSQGHQEINFKVNATKVEADVKQAESKVVNNLQTHGVVAGVSQTPPALLQQQQLPGLPPTGPQQQAPTVAPNIPSTPEQWPAAPAPPPPVDVYNLPR
jgi:hypothetical protein